MKTRWLAVFGLLAPVGLLVADEGSLPSLGSRGASQGPTTPPNAAPPTAEWSWPTEEQWILSSVARDLAEMALHARRQPVDGLDLQLKASPAEGAPRYEVMLHAPSLGESGFSQTLVLETHVWDPSAYAAFTRGLLTKLRLKRTPAPLATPVFAALVHPTSELLERKNEEISRGLEKAILSPVLNEQAALLLATLSLREAAMGLSDIRHQLNRLTAHLALADALRGDEPASSDGSLASIALSAIVGRQREAVDRIDLKFKEAASAEERAWLTALKMRSTADWRLLPDPGKATLLERLEHARALASMQSPLKALMSLEAYPAEPVVDWGRVLLLRGGVGVEVGALASNRVPEELAELAGVFRISKGHELATDQLVTELAATPGRCLSPSSRGPRPRVIDWGTWAAYCQRHLLAAMVIQEHCLSDLYGIQEEAESFRKEMRGKYAALPLFRFLEASWQVRPFPQQPGNPSSMPPDAPFCGPAAQLMRRAPEQVPPILWPLLVQHCPRSSWTKELIDPGLWFQPRLPRGTTFDYDLKKPLVMLGLLWTRGAEVLEPLHALAPYDKWILRDLVAVKYGAAVTPEQIEELWGPIREYDATLNMFLLRAAARRDDASLLRYAKKACDADAEACAHCAAELSDRGLGAEALPLFERGYENARERVGLSNHASWAIDRYFDSGQTEKALKVAQEGAAVYSEAGLVNMGRLLERLAQYKEAEAVYKRMAERYPGSRWELELFYVRYQKRIGGDLFPEAAEKAMNWAFPKGLERASVESWKEPPFPLEGATVPPEGPRALLLKRAGVIPGDLIMAVDGIRVRNDTQYVCVMRLRDESQVSILVWREGRLLELKGPILRLHFGPRADQAK